MARQANRLGTWFESAGISFDVSLIRVQSVSRSGGLGVFAVRDLCEGQKLCEIPKKAVLSVRNTNMSDILEQHLIRGGLGLIIAIMYELSIGRHSFW